LLVFLHRPVEVLLENIKKRGREYEQEISGTYLQDIQNTYFEYFRSEGNIPILVIDVERLDFLRDPSHYQMILEALGKTYPPGIHHVSFVNS